MGRNRELRREMGMLENDIVGRRVDRVDRIEQRTQKRMEEMRM